MRERLPLISVGICAYNEQENIGSLLENLLTEQDLPSESEIIVVCSGCTDRTPEIVKKYAEKDRRIRLIVEPTRKGKTSALNKILSHYQGDHLFLLSADVRPETGSLKRLIGRFTNDRIGAVGGRPISSNNRGLTGSMVHVLWKIHHHTLKFLNEEGCLTHVSGELFCIRRGVVKAIPPSIVNDDAYIALRASQQGYLVKYEPESRVYINGPTNIVDYITQRKRILYGHLQLKHIVGSFPRNIETMSLYDQRRVIRLLASFSIKNPKLLFGFLLLVFIEVLLNLYSLLDIIRGKSHTTWKIAGTTKARVRRSKERSNSSPLSSSAKRSRG